MKYAILAIIAAAIAAIVLAPEHVGYAAGHMYVRVARGFIHAVMIGAF